MSVITILTLSVSLRPQEDQGRCQVPRRECQERPLPVSRPDSLVWCPVCPASRRPRLPASSASLAVIPASLDCLQPASRSWWAATERWRMRNRCLRWRKDWSTAAARLRPAGEDLIQSEHETEFSTRWLFQGLTGSQTKISGNLRQVTHQIIHTKWRNCCQENENGIRSPQVRTRKRLWGQEWWRSCCWRWRWRGRSQEAARKRRPSRAGRQKTSRREAAQQHELQLSLHPIAEEQGRWQAGHTQRLAARLQGPVPAPRSSPSSWLPRRSRRLPWPRAPPPWWSSGRVSSCRPSWPPGLPAPTSATRASWSWRPPWTQSAPTLQWNQQRCQWPEQQTLLLIPRGAGQPAAASHLPPWCHHHGRGAAPVQAD